MSLLWVRKLEWHWAEVPCCEPPTEASSTSANTLKCVHGKFLWYSLGGFAGEENNPTRGSAMSPLLSMGIW